MRTLLIFDSQFGNTKLLAQEMARVLEEYSEVSMVRATHIDSDIFTGVDLLVIGGPTQGHGMSQNVRVLLETAEERAGSAVMTTRPMALAFDTRMSWPRWLSGSAADKIARRLEEMGCTLLAAPESFTVKGGEGPLSEGEMERAISWLRGALARMSTPATA